MFIIFVPVISHLVIDLSRRCSHLYIKMILTEDLLLKGKNWAKPVCPIYCKTTVKKIIQYTNKVQMI